MKPDFEKQRITKEYGGKLMKYIKTLSLTIVLVLVLSGSALAVTWDWTGLSVGPNPLPTTYYYTDGTDGVTLEGVRFGNAANLSYFSDDGFGVWGSPENDEVASPEYLVLTFDAPVYLQEVYLTDLFYEGGYFEQGTFGFGAFNGTDYEFAQDSYGQTQSGSNGEYTLSMADFGLEDTLVSYIWFTAPGLSICGQNHEFSIAGLSFEHAVPVPGAVWLLGSGLIGLVGLRRKYQG
jgi:hypothetical protein